MRDYVDALSWITVCLIVFLPQATSKSGEPNRPNVVLIVTDDHGFGDIGWNDSKVETPTLDRLASEGCRLDRFYSNPICSVTRAALMSGVASIRTGVNNRSGLPSKYRTLPQVFESAGYATWMVGKWHLGGNEDNSLSTPEYLPQNRGFDHFYGHLHGAIDYYTHERKDLGELDWQRNGKPVEEKGFSTDLLVDEALRLIERRDTTKPFLLYVAFNAVHGPLQPPPSSPETNRREKREILTANLKHMDQAVAKIMKSIQSQGIDEETIVLFFGDNGGQLSNGASNGPLRGEKGTTFEGGIRVPALLRWPGTIDPGQRSAQFVNVADVLPTLASACGIRSGLPDDMDGTDLWPALKSGKVIFRPPFVMGNRDLAVFEAPWKLVSTGRGEKPLLFDISSDPNESRDVASDHPEIVAKLFRSIPKNARNEGVDKSGRTRAVPAKKASR